MLFFITIAALVILLEAKIKERIRSLPPESLPRTCCGGRIRIQHMENTGFAASRLAHRPEIVQLTSALSLLIGFFTFLPKLIRSKRDGGFLLGAGLLFGGALSNLSDRTLRGSVTDYVVFPRAPWKKLRQLVFNVSDFCILLGTTLVLLRTLFRKRR